MDKEKGIVPFANDRLQEFNELQPNVANIILHKEVEKELEKTFEKVIEDTTDPAYIGSVQGFAYIDSKYQEDKFDRYFKISKTRVIKQEIFQNYWIYTTVEVDVFLPNGMVITRAGSGAARIQMRKAVKEAIEAGEDVKVTPFDYINFGNSIKSSLTNALSNAYSRFKVGADVYKRIIMSKEQLAYIKKGVEYIARTYVAEPRDRISLNEKWGKAKNPGDKMKVLNELQTEYNVSEEEILQNINKIKKDGKTSSSKKGST